MLQYNSQSTNSKDSSDMKLVSNMRTSKRRSAVVALMLQMSQILEIDDETEVHVWSTTKIDTEPGETFYALTQVSDGQIQIVLNSRLSKTHLVATIAHELIHVKQISEGRLAWNEDECPMWCGEVVDLPYEQQPWEIEAYEGTDALVAELVERMEENYGLDKTRLQREPYSICG
jgi:hypothetical protein